MIGGVICPPAEAAASTPPAKCPGYPKRFILGIVSDPVDTVLATDDPEIVPKNAEDTTDTLAGPPTYCPATMVALSMNNCPSPVRCAITPNSTKWNTMVETTHSVTPKIPSCGKYIEDTKVLKFTPGCFSNPGNIGPKRA